MKKTKGFAIRLTGEALTKMLRKEIVLPEDSFLFKTACTRWPEYCFEFLFKSKEGFVVREGEDFTVISDKKDLPTGEKR